MLLIGIVFSLILSPVLNASSILTCKTEFEQNRAVLEVDEIGTARLSVNLKGEWKSRCDLKIKSLSFKQRRSPDRKLIGFQILKCDPLLGQTQEETLFKRLTLEITNQEQSPVGYFQWLRHGQTSRCTLVKYDQESLNRNFEKWNKGLWGH